MFAVIYQFEVKKNMETEFVINWKQMTQFIYEYEGSLGSRLHKQKKGVYIAYAQWPSKETWKNSGNKLPHSATVVRTKMQETCTKIETLYQLECVENLTKSTTYIHTT